jgi:hypothetical protein
MLVALAAKIVAVAALSAAAVAVAAFGHLGTMGQSSTAPNAGAFGGHVTHVGSIDWDVAPQTSAGMSRVSCPSTAHTGTACYVTSGR